MADVPGAAEYAPWPGATAPPESSHHRFAASMNPRTCGLHIRGYLRLLHGKRGCLAAGNTAGPC